ncbi:MAG TPA: YMGG-like glycine zipper-containing protein [Candidatus Acidoferrales bacterium]|nr:YMGG-like glycine zipper-containing protein [Candidatus Acidoferrales bacterium]
MKRFATLCGLLIFFALSAQIWGAPQYSQRGGEIVLAEYGRDNRWTDVSQRVSTLARGDVLSFRVDDATLGVTSRPGAESVLRILVLTRNGQVRWLTFRENQDINLRGYTFSVAALGDLRIIRATYGTNIRSNDVTNRLNSQIRDGQLSMAVNNSTMGGDPDHDRPKTLRVTYSIDGREDRITVAEGGYLNLPRDATAGRYDLRIIRATYGTNVRSSDVTDRLNSQIRDGQLSMSVNNSTMGGDPDHDRPKTLRVTYSVDGREDRITVAEGGYLNLPRDTVGDHYDLRIIRATYGTYVRSNDVTDRLNSQIRDGQISMAVNNSTMGGDPDHDRPKTLTVTYSLNGREDQISVPEGGYLNLPRDSSSGGYDLRIIRATYGTYVRSNDVTNRLTSQIRDGRLSMAVNNSTMGGDPDHDRPKILTVDYSIGGREDRITVAEGGSLNLPRDVYGTRLISRGTQISIRTNEAIDSKTAREGQRFSASVEQDVLDNSGSLAIPKGSDVDLVILSTEGSDLVLDIDSVVVGGRRYSLDTEDLREKGREGLGANKRTAARVGGGAILGALIGAVVGGGKGAAIGAAIGAVGGAVLTKGKEVNVPSETVLNFRLEQDLYLNQLP